MEKDVVGGEEKGDRAGGRSTGEAQKSREAPVETDGDQGSRELEELESQSRNESHHAVGLHGGMTCSAV